jgi:hypothetical protein
MNLEHTGIFLFNKLKHLRSMPRQSHYEDEIDEEMDYEEEEESAKPTNINGFSSEYFDEKNRMHNMHCKN